MTHIILEGDAITEVVEYDALDFEHVEVTADYYSTGYCHSCQTTTTRSQLDRSTCGICGAFVFDEES